MHPFFIGFVLALAPVFAGSAAACGVAAPIKLSLQGEVLPSLKVAEQLKAKLPCRLESSALSCKCRPQASAVIEVTVGFQWKDARLSQVSERRLKELGDGLRSIEGYGGATIKPVGGRTVEKARKTVLLQRKAEVARRVAAAPVASAAVVSQAGPVRPVATQPLVPKARWVKQKFLISAVFV